MNEYLKLRIVPYTVSDHQLRPAQALGCRHSILYPVPLTTLPNIGRVLQRSLKKAFTLYCTLYSNMNSGVILQNVRRGNARDESNWWKITKSKMFFWVVRKVHCLYPFFCVICMPADASQSLPAPAIQYLSSISLLSICASQKAIGRSFAASDLQNSTLHSPISSARGCIFHRHDITLFF